MTPQEATTRYRRWLDAHRDDPRLIASCHRIGRILTEGGDDA